MKDVLILIDRLDDLVRGARSGLLTTHVRVDRQDVYDIVAQIRATVPEEIKLARWITKEREEMLAEAKREAARALEDARQEQARRLGAEEVARQAERRAYKIVQRSHSRERDIRLGAEDYADAILNRLELYLDGFRSAVQRGRNRLAGTDDA